MSEARHGRRSVSDEEYQAITTKFLLSKTRADFERYHARGWLRQNVPISIDAAAGAVNDDQQVYDFMEIDAFLKEIKLAVATTDAMNGAAENDELLMVEYLAQRRNEGCTGRTAFALLALDHVDIYELADTHFAIDKASPPMLCCEGPSDECEIVRQMYRKFTHQLGPDVLYDVAVACDDHPVVSVIAERWAMHSPDFEARVAELTTPDRHIERISARMCVLTQRAHFEQIVAFIPGSPKRVVDLMKGYSFRLYTHARSTSDQLFQ